MKRFLIFFFLITGVSAFGQFSKKFDTVFYDAGGYTYYYAVSGDTVFINDDTIYNKIYYYNESGDTVFINADTIPTPVYSYTTSGDTTFINEDTLIVLSGQGRILFDTTTLSIAQVDALHTDSIELIPIPGANKYINVINAVVRVDSDGTPNIGAGTLDMTYNTSANGTPGGNAVISLLAAAVFNTASENQWYFPTNNDTGVDYTKQTPNVSVVLWLSDANIGDDTRLKVYITYQILEY